MRQAGRGMHARPAIRHSVAPFTHPCARRRACGGVVPPSFLRRFARVVRVVQAPARRRHEADRGPHVAGRCDVAGDARRVLELDDERIARAGRRDEAETARLVSTLGDTGAEGPLEHARHAAFVRIETVEVRRMMHAVRGRRVEHVCEPAGLRHPRVVQPERVHQVERVAACAARRARRRPAGHNARGRSDTPRPGRATRRPASSPSRIPNLNPSIPCKFSS